MLRVLDQVGHVVVPFVIVIAVVLIGWKVLQVLSRLRSSIGGADGLFDFLPLHPEGGIGEHVVEAGVRPDAYGVWEEGGGPLRIEFFVEHDTGTETLARVAAKLEGYRDLAEAEGSTRSVLFWLAQPGREPALRRALEGTALPVATAVAGRPAEIEPEAAAAGDRRGSQTAGRVVRVGPA